MWKPSVNTEKKKADWGEILISLWYFLLTFYVLFHYILKTMQRLFITTVNTYYNINPKNWRCREWQCHDKYKSLGLLFFFPLLSSLYQSCWVRTSIWWIKQKTVSCMLSWGKLPEKEHCDLGWIASGGRHSSFHWFLWNENKQMEVNAFLKLCMCVQLLQS